MMAHSTFVALSYGISALVFVILIVAIILDGQRQKQKLKRLETLNANKRQQTPNAHQELSSHTKEAK